MKLAHGISLVLIGTISMIGAAAAGPEKIKFPEGFEKGVRYAVVDRHDNKQYRELYANEEAVKAIANVVYGAMHGLHANHGQAHPDTGKRISIGLV